MASIDVLVKTRDLMADPDQVVFDPIHLYETDAGTTVQGPAHATRGCFMGNFYRAADQLGEPVDIGAFATAVFPDLKSGACSCAATDALREGREHCVALLDQAIARVYVDRDLARWSVAHTGQCLDHDLTLDTSPEYALTS